MNRLDPICIHITEPDAHLSSHSARHTSSFIAHLKIKNRLSCQTSIYVKGKPQSISRYLCQPMILLGQLIGLISWDFNHRVLSQKDTQIWRRVLAILYQFCVAVIIVYTAVEQEEFYLTRSYPSVISMLAINANKLTHHAFMILVFLLCATIEKRFCDVIKQLIKSDSVLEMRICRRKFFLKHVGIRGFVKLLVAVFWIIRNEVLNENQEISYNFYVFVMATFGWFVGAFFILTTRMCSELFVSINLELKQIIDSKDLQFKESLLQFRLRYEELYRQIEVIQSTFSGLITVLLVKLTINLCTMAYTVLNIKDFILMDTLYVMDLALMGFEMFTISAAADDVVGKPQLGLANLNNVRRIDVSHSEAVQITLLVNKLSQGPIAISLVGGLITINKKSFTTIIGTIITYLVVLLQFRPSETIIIFSCNNNTA